MDSTGIRKTFFDFFERRDHRAVPSSSLIPNDPTLLLTNAGMNQFKPYFLGEQTAPFKRAVTVQKCFRTPDIDEVGKTQRHLTFFEMLGNFSFGDYYKRDACPWAWELVTEGWGIDPDRLWVTIYETDEEAHRVWTEAVGVRPERVVRRGRGPNYWDMGVAGPCGPCSEIYVDLGPAFGDASEAGPQGNEDRYLEIWNLVFMENDCNAAIEPVAELPSKNIDTGAGLERIALVLQNAQSVFETDILGAMVVRAEELTERRYGESERSDMSLRVLADHGRGITFLIADGVLPSNEKRGYVLRRVMRRAVRHARLLGRDEPVLAELAEAAIEVMGGAYPELRGKRDFVLEVASAEEDRFASTLRQGLSLLEGEIAGARRSRTTFIPGEVAFRLHDTYGFPIDLTVEIAGESGLRVDVVDFSDRMDRQRAQARAARRAGADRPAAAFAAALLDEHGPTEFIGYEHLGTTASVIAISAGSRGVHVAGEGDEVELLLDRTVFYAESGGQVADRGVITGPGGRAEVKDVQHVVPGISGHLVRVTDGEIRVGDEVDLRVDARWRRGAERAHTATHILHWTLRDRLGEHARQAGSLVEPGRLRFDFQHFEALEASRISDISDELQERVLADDPVRAYETSFEYARSVGAMALFGEKYGDFVRVVEIGEYSKELCGGTHVPHTSQIGVAILTAESSIGANLRRVEALVGHDGLRWLERRAAVLDRAAAALKSPPEEVADKLERLLAQHKDMERRLAELDRKQAEADAAALAESAVDVDGARLLVARRDLPVDALRSLAQALRSRLGTSVVVLGAAAAGKANLVGAVSRDLTSRGISARDLLSPGAQLLGGGAGGKPELAISGGPAADKIEDAIGAVATEARRALQGEKAG